MKLVLAAPQRRYDALEQDLRERHGFDVLRVRQPDELTRAALERFGARYVFFPHWSWRIPADVHTRFECVIFHASDVPYGRGGSPIQNHIVNGNTETKLSALRCVDELDPGAVYLKRALDLRGTIEEILGRAAALMREMIVEIVERPPAPAPQAGVPVIFKRRTPAQGDLGTLGTTAQVYDYIRMLDGEGYPPAFLETPNLRFEFTDAHETSDGLTATVRIVAKGKGPAP